jgi:hypothetical protein
MTDDRENPLRAFELDDTIPTRRELEVSDPLHLGITGTDLYDATRPAAFAEPETGYAWRRFVGALSLLLDPVADVCRGFDDQERWTQLADPRRCPPQWLRVLAQWAGIRRPDAMTEDELRELIGTGGPGFWRGTREAMIAAVRRFLPPGTADQFLYFEERADGQAYHLRVFTYTFVDHDEDQVRTALEAAKPAGLILDYQVRRGQNWWMLKQREGTWADVRDDYENWAAVLEDEPIVVPNREAA